MMYQYLLFYWGYTGTSQSFAFVKHDFKTGNLQYNNE